MTQGPAEVQVITQLISDVFCECRVTLQADVGRLSGELYRRVDVEGRNLEDAAGALALGMREARTLLFLFRRQMASALVRTVLAERLPEAYQTLGEGARRGSPDISDLAGSASKTRPTSATTRTVVTKTRSERHSL